MTNNHKENTNTLNTTTTVTPTVTSNVKLSTTNETCQRCLGIPHNALQVKGQHSDFSKLIDKYDWIHHCWYSRDCTKYCDKHNNTSCSKCCIAHAAIQSNWEKIKRGL